jgi:hypothetical protein
VDKRAAQSTLILLFIVYDFERPQFLIFVCRSTSVAIFLLSALGMVAFTFTLDQGQIWIVFLTAGLLG